MLRPGGLLEGSDRFDTSASRDLPGYRYNPVDSEMLPERLREAGFVNISLDGAHKELYETGSISEREPAKRNMDLLMEG